MWYNIALIIIFIKNTRNNKPIAICDSPISYNDIDPIILIKTSSKPSQIVKNITINTIPIKLIKLILNQWFPTLPHTR